MSDLSTRRAIEICLARVPMCREASRSLMVALRREIEHLSPEAPMAHDAVRLRLLVALDYLSGIDATFPKSAILDRVADARREIMACVQPVGTAANIRDAG